MGQQLSERLADSLAGIATDLDQLRYELETVRDIEEAVRLARRVEERFLALAGRLEATEYPADLHLGNIASH